jgi:hypothetical protein
MSFDFLGQLPGEVAVVRFFLVVLYCCTLKTCVTLRFADSYGCLLDDTPQGSYKHYLYAHDSLEL